MVTSSWSGCQLTCSDTFSLCSTLLLVWCSGFAAMTPSQMLSQPFTGCVYLNGLTSKSLWWRFMYYMVWHRNIWISWFVLPTFLVATVCAHLHPNCCTFRHTVLLLSTIARFRLLDPSFGTRYLQLSSSRLLCLFLPTSKDTTVSYILSWSATITDTVMLPLTS